MNSNNEFDDTYFLQLILFKLILYLLKELINLAMAGPQEIFKKHLIKNEEQPFFSKIYSAHFGTVSTL